jgi:hypothetical protein
MIQIDPLDCLEIRQCQEAAQMGFNVALAVGERRDAKCDPRHMEQHLLCAQVQSITTQADPLFDFARAAEEMNKRFLV